MAKTDPAVASKKAAVKKKAFKKIDAGTPKRRRLKLPHFLRAIGGYFAGAWREIRQVRWPNRKATWSLTAAVLVFTVFWGLVVLGLDILFQMLLNRVILN